MMTKPTCAVLLTVLCAWTFMAHVTGAPAHFGDAGHKPAHEAFRVADTCFGRCVGIPPKQDTCWQRKFRGDRIESACAPKLSIAHYSPSPTALAQRLCSQPVSRNVARIRVLRI